MNRVRRLLCSLRIAKSTHSTQISRTRPLYFQVNQFSHFSPSVYKQPHPSPFLNTHQKLLFSSNPDSIADLVLADDWSEKLDRYLLDTNLTLNHEIVIYILKKLDEDPEKASKFFNRVCDEKGFKPCSSIFSLMLRIFANKESMKQFWVTIKKMKDQGFYIDEETYKTIMGIFQASKMARDVTALTHFYNRMLEENAMEGVVKNVVQVVTGNDWGPEVDKKLTEMNISMSDNFVSRVLRVLRKHPLKALSFFKWVGEHSSFEHSSITYNALIRVLGGDESTEKFWSMVKEMKIAGHEVDLDTYIKISRQFLKSKMFNDAVELYELMMDGPYKPEVGYCSTLLLAIAGTMNPDLDLVFRVVKKYEAAGNSLSKPVYDGIHRSLTGLGRFDEAEKIVEAMKNAGYQPDNITYSQLVFGLCKAKRLEEACQLLDEMEANGCAPDLKTWTILIKGHCAAEELDKALLCFTNMMEKNCDADADLLEILINGFLSQNRMDGAYKLLVEMVNKALLRPWQATYKNLILKLLGERKLEEALNLLHLMKKHNYPPFPEPFVEHISKFGTVGDANDFLKALRTKEYPSLSAYLHVFEAFFQEGRHSEAKDLLYECPHHVRKHKATCDLFGSAKSSSTAAVA